MAGWVVAEVGRQPWIIERLMPTLAAVSDVETTSVQTTFWIFAGVFTVLLIAEIKIMIGQIKKGMTPARNRTPRKPDPTRIGANGKKPKHFQPCLKPSRLSLCNNTGG